MRDVCRTAKVLASALIAATGLMAAALTAEEHVLAARTSALFGVPPEAVSLIAPNVFPLHRFGFRVEDLRGRVGEVGFSFCGRVLGVSLSRTLAPTCSAEDLGISADAGKPVMDLICRFWAVNPTDLVIQDAVLYPADQAPPTNWHVDVVDTRTHRRWCLRVDRGLIIAGQPVP